MDVSPSVQTTVSSSSPFSWPLDPIPFTVRIPCMTCFRAGSASYSRTEYIFSAAPAMSRILDFVLVIHCRLPPCMSVSLGSLFSLLLLLNMLWPPPPQRTCTHLQQDYPPRLKLSDMPLSLPLADHAYVSGRGWSIACSVLDTDLGGT